VAAAAVLSRGARGGGVNYYPLTTNVFMLSAVFDENRLVSRSGKPDLFGRKLDHCVAHEIAHTLTARATGVLRFHARLSNWVKEGYAEYVGWGDDAPPYEESARALSAEAPQMNVPPAVPHLRINLLVTYLIEKKGWSVARLLDDAVSQREVEAMLKADAAEMR
jgi:hypothetical protein